MKEDVTQETRKYLEINENKTQPYQNSWDAVKALPRDKCAALDALFYFIFLKES